MADGGGRLFELVEARPAPGGCREPIGRRRTARPSRSRPAARPSPTVLLLAELRALIVAMGEDERTRSRHVARLLASQVRTTAGLAEQLDRFAVRITALERALGTCEQPAAPRPTRRSPCA